MNNNLKLNFFVNELTDINDSKLRQFAVQLILNAPDYFFTAPASSSGKYHPYFAREESGLVKHTRCVVFYAECNAESFDFNVHDRDLIIIAAIAHDIKKQGNDNYGKHTVWNHPELAHDYILEMQNSYPNLISLEDATIIANAVLCHMGKWAHYPEFTKKKKQYPMPKSFFEYALQSADYVASRTELTGFAFRTTEGLNIPNDIIVESKAKIPNLNIGDTVFNFGKYKNKTIKEVFEKYPDYIDWIINKKDFNNIEMQEKIKKYLLEIKK